MSCTIWLVWYDTDIEWLKNKQCCKQQLQTILVQFRTDISCSPIRTHAAEMDYKSTTSSAWWLSILPVKRPGSRVTWGLLLSHAERSLLLANTLFLSRILWIYLSFLAPELMIDLWIWIWPTSFRFNLCPWQSYAGPMLKMDICSAESGVITSFWRYFRLPLATTSISQ